MMVRNASDGFGKMRYECHALAPVSFAFKRSGNGLLNEVVSGMTQPRACERASSEGCDSGNADVVGIRQRTYSGNDLFVGRILVGGRRLGGDHWSRAFLTY